jgi:hypothetical protein
LKRINDFCRSYLSNGFIENSQFYLDVIQKNFEKKADLKQPFWILLSSVITSNYETIFSAFDRMPPELVSKYVLNLFCNSKDGSEKYSCQKLFVRAHLLNYMYRFREVSYQELKATYYKLINDCKEEFFDKSFNRCIYRFLETNILVSPEVYIPNKVDSVANVRNLTITETGRYYLDTFSSYFEYSMYLKDDVDLPPNINILSCVQEPDRKKQFENEVLKFFTFLTNEEMKFISELDKSQRKILLDKFSSPIPQTQNSPIISQFPLNRIREYGEKIGYKTEGYINLEKEIAKFVADMM